MKMSKILPSVSSMQKGNNTETGIQAVPVKQQRCNSWP